MKPYRIRLEYGKTRPGTVCVIESPSPQISWALAAGRGERQTAYRLEVSLRGDPVWDTGWVKTGGQTAEYAGKRLEPGEVYSLSVRLKDAEDAESEEVFQEFCLGSLEAWQAPWIGEDEEQEDRVLSFVRDMECGAGIVSACLFVCGLGYSKVMLNGEHVFTSPMNPAYSEYEKRCYYMVLPGLERILKTGDNRIGIHVAAGWRSPFNVCYELTKRIPDYTGSTQLSAALRVKYADGTVEWVYTDKSWQYFYGPTVYSNIFLGERYEAGLRIPLWSEPGIKIDGLKNAAQVPAPGGKMVPQTLEPVLEKEVYRAVTVNEVAEGVYGVDFGQNLAGVCRIRIPRNIRAGQVIEIYHMEFLGEDGRLYLPQLRGAKSVDTYVAAGGGKDPEFWQPEYTYHGFRYAEVKGYPHPLEKGDISAVSCYTDIDKASYFKCGHPLANAIQQNLVQTEKANIHSVLTDCPQRDERMGWLNDATVRFEETAYNFDIGRLFPKVVRDCMDIQAPDGSITCTAPFAFGARPADPVCSSYLLSGWLAYMHTGNSGILREGYEGFKAWNDFLESKSEGYIVQYSYYGDWAAPAYACESEEYAVSSVTPGILMSTGYFYYNAILLAKIARVINRSDETALYEEKAAEIRKAFLKEWWDEKTGRVGTGSQGCQSFALWLDILPEEGRQKAADFLHNDLVEKGYQFTTGNLCTRYIMDVLTRYGYIEDAWALITRDEYPSIGFTIQHEATTIWERFELKKTPLMNSHNHPMYGAVGYWFYAWLAGARPLKAGWEEFEVEPFMPKNLLSMNAAVETPFGDVTVRWTKRYGEAHLYVGVPHGAKAHVKTPWGVQEIVEGGFHHWSVEI